MPHQRRHDPRRDAGAVRARSTSAGLRLQNRLIMAPMGTCLDEGGHITDATIAYYRRRAEGGVGTITVEGWPRLRRHRRAPSRRSAAPSTCRA